MITLLSFSSLGCSVSSADGAAAPVDLGATFTSMLGSLTSSFNGAVPAVAGVAGGIVAVMIGIPLVMRLFHRIVG